LGMGRSCACTMRLEEISLVEDSLGEEALSQQEGELPNNALLGSGGVRYVIKLLRSVQG
jgi:hypothetical protein